MGMMVDVWEEKAPAGLEQLRPGFSRCTAGCVSMGQDGDPQRAAWPGVVGAVLPALGCSPRLEFSLF